MKMRKYCARREHSQKHNTHYLRIKCVLQAHHENNAYCVRIKGVFGIYASDITVKLLRAWVPEIIAGQAISLRRKASGYSRLMRHSRPTFIAGISCWAIILRTCCFVVFSNTAVSATVNSSVMPTDRHPFGHLHFSCLHNIKNCVTFAHRTGSTPSLPLHSSVG